MGAGRGGYLTSAGVFAGVTALWALMTRDDAFYGDIAIGGFSIPATMIAYLVAMPFVGFLVGRWRYERHEGGGGALFPKLGARAVHFLYAHSLIVLFTLAMVAEGFFGLNLDAQVKAIDARVFDLAERFTPWLAAYLAGFNLGRFARGRRDAGAAQDKDADAWSMAARAEPVLETRAGAVAAPLDPQIPHHEDEERRRPMAAASLQSGPDDPPPSNFARWTEAAGEQGFLPPQDLDRLRPRLRELR